MSHTISINIKDKIKLYIYMYIYIGSERERERERQLHSGDITEEISAIHWTNPLSLFLFYSQLNITCSSIAP